MAEEAYVGKHVNQATLDEAKSRLFSSDEKLFCAIRGVVTKKRGGPRARPEVMSGFLLITSKRVVFYVPKIFGRYEQLVFPYDQISSVSCHKGLIGDRLDLTVASDYIMIDRIPKGDGDIAAQNIRDLVGTMKAQPSFAVVASQTDVAAQIEKLNKLRKEGAITKEEFERMKKKLLQ